jgi:hypothetical protein
VINAFEFANPQYTVTVVDNGATATLAEHISLTATSSRSICFWQPIPTRPRPYSSITLHWWLPITRP